ncbi:hypothetical protein PVK06_030481 [Gossypium arboreum]|uniref:RNase H type-1 domain-containing protein n=1 Tax=Gossypium arboreum TaxID=29729 RepID=A0ABR0NND7_GOSAR|nr:hypothetical protein PVK06_030481 [Gossypium arboreum]
MRTTVYFDAAFDKRTSRSASGLVVCGMEGDIMASKSVIHSNISSSFVAEAHTGLKAIQLGIEMRLHSLDIKRDSRTVIKKCQFINQDKSIIRAIIRYINSKKVFFQNIGFYFIPKTENENAHFIVKEAIRRGEGHYLLGLHPQSFHQARERRRQEEQEEGVSRLPDA